MKDKKIKKLRKRVPKKSPSQKVSAKNEKGSVTRHLEALKGTVFTETRLISTLDYDLKEAWNKLRSFAKNLGDQRIYASAQSIMFSKKVCYFYVRPKKKYLEVWIFLPRKIDGLTIMQGPSKKEKYCNLFKLVHPDQVEEPLTNWIQDAFEFAV